MLNEHKVNSRVNPLPGERIHRTQSLKHSGSVTKILINEELVKKREIEVSYVTYRIWVCEHTDVSEALNIRSQ